MSTMNLFIDSNIFLKFYDFSGHDIKELQKLVALVISGDIILFIPLQLRQEIKRNRGVKISASMDKFRKTEFKVEFPAFCKIYPEYAEIRKNIKDLNKKHSKLFSKVKKDIKLRKLKADSLINDLLKNAKNIKPKQKVYDAALKRFRLGNPPGKKRITIGDEMNWETLLDGVPDGEKLVFVSGDRDYFSPDDSTTLNYFLDEEWKKKKNCSIEFYNSLLDFFKNKFPDIRLASDVMMANLIQRLSKSGTFATTHAIIASLSKQETFSDSQVEELVTIAELNNQVGWIVGDEDVLGFFEKIINKCGDKMKEESKIKFCSLLHHETPEVPAEIDLDEEIPF